MCIGNTKFYGEQKIVASLTASNFEPPPKYVRFNKIYVQLHEAKETNIDGVTFTQQHHLPLLRQMRTNLIGSSLFFSFCIDYTGTPIPAPVSSTETEPKSTETEPKAADPSIRTLNGWMFHFLKLRQTASTKGVFFNASDPLSYISTELLPLLSVTVPIISIDLRCLNNPFNEFGQQFLHPLFQLRPILYANRVEILINRDVPNSQFSFDVSFEHIFKWLHFAERNHPKNPREFSLEVCAHESRVPAVFFTELEALEARITSVVFKMSNCTRSDFKFSIDCEKFY